MIAHAPSTRRDARHAVRYTGSYVEFPKPLSEGCGNRAALVLISISGLACEVEGPADLAVGAIIKNASVHVGDCRLDGDLVVRSINPTEDPKVEVGCLFYPADRSNADRLMALIAGIEAATACAQRA